MHVAGIFCEDSYLSIKELHKFQGALGVSRLDDESNLESAHCTGSVGLTPVVRR